jgi:S-phase kinase-associated protein 1
MKLVRLPIFGSILVLSLRSAQSFADQVTLQAADGQEFRVEVKVAKKSETIKNLIEDAGIEHPIPLPNIIGKTLTNIVEVMKYASDHPFDPAHPVDSNRALLIYLNELLREKDVSTSELSDVVRGFNYLDVQRERAGDVLNPVLKLYGDRLFGHIELENLRRIATAAAYTAYAQAKLDLPPDLQKIIVRESLHSIDRIFLDTSPDRRIHAFNATPLAVAQIIAYIAKNQTKSAAELPPALRDVLIRWQGADFASKIHFGPWPTQIATWPGHCPLRSDPNYNMYSDATPDDRYIDNGDGTVTDVCTRLTWEQAPSMPEGPWEASIKHCAQLNKDRPLKKSKTDLSQNSNLETEWRAPTRIELQSLVNYTADNPALNAIFRVGILLFWSSSPAVDYDDLAWVVNFVSGTVQPLGIAWNNSMRCVRGERGGPQAVGAKKHYAYAERSFFWSWLTSAPDTVTDNFTGAVWQRRVADEGRDHARTQEYCQNLVLDGTGWRLPTVKTLSTLVDVRVSAPRIDRAAFPGTPAGSFWSSSPRAVDPNFALHVGFNDGQVYDNHVANDFRARCVR